MTKERKHPKGLMVLFFTEMWERFGFYLIIGIFFLYMTAGGDAKFPGMGFSGAKASDIYGSYLALVYLTPFIGGLLADRYLGYRLSITIGGLLFSAGYFGLAIPNSENAFYISLLLIIMGNGLFKPNISALVGKIYDSNPKYKPLKDSGYNIFYMGINIGGFACNFIAAYLRINYGWGWAFAAAGVGMLIGVVWFWTGQTYAHDIKAVDKISPPTKDDMPMKRIFGTLFLPAIIAGFLGWIIPDNVFGSDSTDAFLFFSLVVVIFYINILRKARKQEKEPIKALLAVFGAVVIFWAIFHQNGAALTVWAEKYTDREMGKNSELIMSKLELTETASTAVRIVEETGLHGESKGYSFGPSYYYKNIPASDIEGRRADSILTVAPDDVKEIYSKKYIVNTIKDFDQQISEAKNKEEIYEITNNKEEWISAKDKWLSIIGISKDDDLSWANVDPTKKGNHAIIKALANRVIPIHQSWLHHPVYSIGGWFFWLHGAQKKKRTRIHTNKNWLGNDYNCIIGHCYDLCSNGLQ
jgi:POT family proton-dependent oligopeptide transporter